MNELVFEVEQDGEWLVATCHNPEMATQAETIEALAPMIRDLVSCRFEIDEPQRQWPIRLHFVNDPVLPMSA
jgi:predicted RNase H-like HicB family nuclease